MSLQDKDVREYFHRSYTAVDGLWFVKVEEKYGFDKALNIDKEVWMIMPKIQARFLKSKLNKEKGLLDLLDCFSVKLELDGFKFNVKKDKKSVKFIISNCPWHNIMAKSGRSHLSGNIGEVICNTEYQVWAKEFGDNINFKLEGEICKGAKYCTIIFTKKKMR